VWGLALVDRPGESVSPLGFVRLRMQPDARLIAKGGIAVLAVTFMIIEETLRSSELVFSVLRVCDRRHNLISRHRTKDEAINAAMQYVMQARYSGLDAAFLPVSGMPYAADANGVALSL
jgi:hypothetical protein